MKADAQEKAVYTNLVYIFCTADFQGSLRQNRMKGEPPVCLLNL